ncbi:efflux RND transporter periplasmic adaptor subunit [Tunturiibacter gelidoferens]|uniref:Efflux RND transporter periplasmic adaptor subunit n=1 Tax=Tunturiibacter gelidiferens TaxID=3069689 RepID=A0AAU7YZY5_9BACT
MATMTMTAPSKQESKPGKLRGWWILLILLVGVLAALAWWALHRKAAAEANSNQYKWILPEIRSTTTDVNATGTVKLKTGAVVRVGAQLSGIVRRLNVTVGSHVKQGDVIAEIDSRPVTARIDQARAQLAQAEVAQAKAQTDFSRTQKLIEAGLVPVQQFDDAKASLDASKASVAAAQSGLAAAQVDLAYVDIRAPIAGTVASISTQQGETVAASFATPTFVTIIQEAALEVIAMVDEADIGNVRRGEKVTFTTETFPDHEFEGIVTRIAPVATIISGVVNYEVAISIERDLALLKPDMTANVNIHTSQLQAVLIPTKCIHRDGPLSFVYMQRTGAVPLKRVVSVGTRMANETEIVRGLGPNDRVQFETGVAAP